MSSEFRALETLCAGLETLVKGLRDEDWQRPTRCEPMTVKELVTHVTQALDVLLLGEIKPASTKEPVIDRVGYGKSWDGAAAASRILVGAQSQAAGLTATDLVNRMDDRAARVAEQLATLDPDELVGGGNAFAIPAAELIAVYVVETGIHTLDLLDALGADERLDGEAAGVITAALDGLLGAPARPLVAWDDVTYILSGSGRRELSTDERESLGPLAELFPMIR